MHLLKTIWKAHLTHFYNHPNNLPNINLLHGDFPHNNLPNNINLLNMDLLNNLPYKLSNNNLPNIILPNMNFPNNPLNINLPINLPSKDYENNP